MANNCEKIHKKLIFIVRLLLYSMTIMEIDKKMDNFRKYWYCVYSFLSFFSIALSAVSITFSASSSYERYLAAETAGAVFSVNSILYVSQIKSKNLTNLYLMFKNGVEGENNCRLNIQHKDTYAQCISWSKRFGGFLIAFVSSTIFTTLLQAITGKEYDNKDGTTLLYPSRYPWGFSTGGMYSLTYIWQLITTFPIFVIIWGNMTFTMVTVTIFQSYTEELIQLVKTPYLGKPELYECHMREYIQLHQQLRKYFNEFKSWFDLLFAAEITYVTIEISGLSFAVLKEKQTYGNSVKLLFFMIVVLAQLYFHCSVGEKFYEMNELLRKTLYEVIFSDECFRNPKLIMMFTQQSQIPFTLTGFKAWRASLILLAKILRVSYGFFNVFRATDK